MKENLSKKNMEIWSGAKIRKMSQIGQGGPPRNQKNKKTKGPIWGPGSAA